MPERPTTLEQVTNVLQIVLLVIAIVLLVSSLVLILNAIRMAIFARRREVGVMKLVGATNWFIRVPFMLEGLVQGLLGAVVAVGIVLLGQFGMHALIRHFKEFSALSCPATTCSSPRSSSSCSAPSSAPSARLSRSAASSTSEDRTAAAAARSAGAVPRAPGCGRPPATSSGFGRLRSVDPPVLPATGATSLRPLRSRP